MNGTAMTTVNRLLVACSILALIWLIAAHLTGPSDIWEKNQPMTMSYTTDIIVHGRWVLPTEMGGPSATKPPLYNWIAAPFVAAFGTSSEVAHRAPSTLALIATWIALVIAGNRIGARTNLPGLGWLAGLAFLVNPAMFKLGFLARPDMILTLWLILGWLIATSLILSRNALAPSHRFAHRIAFWFCIALAALAKGPPALILIIYALIAPRILLGRWSETRIFGWSWGVPLAIAPFAAWIFAAWTIDPDHVVNQLWREEVLGRVTGMGEEGNREGPIEFIYRLGHMPFYYITRFLPWSIISILAMIELWRDRKREDPLADGLLRAWLVSAAIMILVIIAFFTPSTGKRAAYIAAAYGPGALLAAWWMIRLLIVRKPAFGSIVPIVTAAMLAGLTIHDRLDQNAPVPLFGSEIRSFIVDSDRRIGEQSDPIVLREFDYLLMRAMLGGPFVDDADEVRSMVDLRRGLWVFTASGPKDRSSIDRFLRELDRDVDAEPLLISADLPAAVRWPGTVTLWRITPQ